MNVLGIDPGLTGALAWLDSSGRLLEVRDMPSVGGEVHALSLLGDMELRSGRVGVAILEWPKVMPQNGAKAAYSMGMTLGTVAAVLTARGIPYERVSPGAWKRSAGHSSDKDTMRVLAMRRWPDHADSFLRKKDHGRAEAALLAWWWLTKGAGATLEVPA